MENNNNNNNNNNNAQIAHDNVYSAVIMTTGSLQEFKQFAENTLRFASFPSLLFKGKQSKQK